MISAQLYDAGTEPVLAPRVQPGYDELYWKESRLEESLLEDRQTEMNRAIVSLDPIEMAPWPEPLPGTAWVDVTQRYAFDGADGVAINLYQVDGITGACVPAPGGQARLTTTPRPEVNLAEERLLPDLTWRQVQARAETPAAWTRHDTKNTTGGTRLEAPLVAVFDRLPPGPGYRIELANNSLFCPFDLTHPERYRLLDDDLMPLPTEGAEHRMTLDDGGVYALYLVPRRWRYVAEVVAHFVWISGWERVPMIEYFIRAWTNRPPFYPFRHDLLTTSQTTQMEHPYYDGLLSYDNGIVWQVDHSRGAAELRTEIVQAQYWTICNVYLLTGVEDARVSIWRQPSRVWDIVAGIGRIDQATGMESRVWLQQVEDVSSLYPQTLLGQYYVPFWVGR
ncbi:MAG: hypothetical protein GY906_11675 [bacterium]|nr:hypothetical protein [bacterium]